MNPRTRPPQLALRLDAAGGVAAAQWHEGAPLPYLGGTLRLVLGATEAGRQEDALLLPLPPQASERQIQDRAEAWLRDEALRVLGELVARKSTLTGRRTPHLQLSFATRGNWVEVRDGDTLRCNWRLIEQALPTIDQVVARAIAALPPENPGVDLFGAPLAAH